MSKLIYNVTSFISLILVTGNYNASISSVIGTIKLYIVSVFELANFIMKLLSNRLNLLQLYITFVTVIKFSNMYYQNGFLIPIGIAIEPNAFNNQITAPILKGNFYYILLNRLFYNQTPE